jgi:diguanylate cyclase (GGDEF)-like protein/PAS domain S-box-containing protein
MKSAHPPLASGMVSQFDANDIAERKAFLEFTPQDATRLAALHAGLATTGDVFTTAFYQHLLSFDALHGLLPDTQSLEQLKRAQAEYFNSLTAGDYGDGYVANRLRVGQVHQRIGLEPKWYIGAYRKYLSDLMPLLWTLCEGDSARFLAHYDSLLKVVLFDIGLALDSYFRADKQALLELKNYADRIICNMPSGLLVLDADFRLLTINLAARDMLGLAETAPVVGQALDQVLASASLATLAREVLANAQSVRSLLLGPLPALNGRVLALTLSATLIDEAPALIIQLQDETESVRAEESLARFRTALDASEDAIYLIDRADMRFVDVNESACRGLGYARHELLQMGPQDIATLLSPQELAEQYDQILANASHAGRLETRHQRKDGSTFPVEIALRGFRSEGRRMLVAVARDNSLRKQSEGELRESEERFRATFQQAAVGIAHVAPDGRWLRVNRKLCEIVGYTREELLQRRFQDLTHPDDLARELVLRQRVNAGEIDSYSMEKRYLYRGSEPLWVGVTVSLVRTPAGQPKYFISVIEDISLRKRTEASLHLLQRAMEASGNGILITDCQQPDNPLVYVNPAFERITGYRADEVLGRNCRFLHGADQNQPGSLLLRQAIANRHEARVVLRNYRKDGTLFWNELYIAPVRDKDGTVTHYVGVQNDISEQKRAEENLLHMATHDNLTGLPNRNLLQDRICQAIGYAERMQREMAVLFIDIDRFKNINDSLGHAAGDQLIVVMAQRLRAAVRIVDTVARVGGDEFVVILTDLSRESDIAKVLPGLLAAITQPMPVDGHELAVTGSIGISVYPRDGRDVSTLLKNADTAMYRAKDAGRNGYRFYAQEMNADAVDRLRLENDLRNAIKGDELMMVYQPQVDAGSGRIIAAEALLRWRHPRHGLISPAEFIPLAEETGLIVSIGEWVLRRVCAQVRGWREAGLPEVKVAVNLSPRQFRQPNLVEMIRAALADYDLPSDWLELEITEGSLMHNPEEAVLLLDELSRLGFRLAVDDFGTGYSSLAYLKRFPLHVLKIDRSFVVDIETNRDSAAIAAAVIALAHSLELKVVAEGVEQPAQMDYLRGLDCDIAQGYLYGRPMPADEFMILMAKQDSAASAQIAAN